MIYPLDVQSRFERRWLARKNTLRHPNKDLIQQNEQRREREFRRVIMRANWPSSLAGTPTYAPGVLLDRRSSTPDRESAGRSIFSSWHSPSFLVRVEDQQLCAEDLCLTVIGHVVEGEFRSDAMFSGGDQFTGSDQSVQVFGFQTLPLWVVGAKLKMTLLDTPKGWIVVTHENETEIPRQSTDTIH
jgi:hypothetical protein